jgi:GNAT superfamily N-acetyltransferase
VELSTYRRRLDRAMVHDFLSTQSYRARDRTPAQLDRVIEHSVCVGAYDPAGSQVGFARGVSGTAVFGYVGDVLVLPAHRGRGIGKRLVGALLEQPELREVTRLMLATDDAHGLYRQFGFLPLRDNPQWMVRLER